MPALILIAAVIALLILLNPAVQVALAVTGGVGGLIEMADGHAALVLLALIVAVGAGAFLLVVLHRRIVFNPVPRQIAYAYA